MRAAKSLIDGFKQDLYRCQISITNKEDLYYKFIDPYLKEAEKALGIIEYMIAEKKTWDFYAGNVISPYYKYKEALLNYNTAYFNAYAKGKLSSASLTFASKNLYDSIVRIKEEAGLSELNVSREFKKTTDLFQRANVAYYKWLSLGKKLKIKVLSVF
jgi:hypothetical protein